jgi:hypothetical protein
MFLANFILVECTGGNLETFSFGAVANYGDVAVQRRIHAIAHDPHQFNALLVELSAASWHLSRHHAVTAMESVGGPDLLVEVPSLELPLAVECKRLDPDTHAKSLARILKRANRQVKAANMPCYGLALVDASSQVPYTAEFSDAVPTRILDLADATRGTLAGQNSSLSAMQLLWDDFLFQRAIADPRAILGWVVLRRRGLRLVRHLAPRHPLPKDTGDIEVAYTIMFAVTSV